MPFATAPTTDVPALLQQLLALHSAERAARNTAEAVALRLADLAGRHGAARAEVEELLALLEEG